MTQMRKLQRNVARTKMKLAGLERLNRKRPAVGGGYMSFFSRNWRDYYKLKINYERRIKERRERGRREKDFFGRLLGKSINV